MSAIELGDPIALPVLAKSYQAFLRDLPQLLAERPGEWAAYASDRCVAVGPSKRSLYRECLASGYHAGEFLVCSIEPLREVVVEKLCDD